MSPAEPPTTAISPNYTINVAAGFFIGAFLGIIVLLLRDRFDSRIRSESDVEQILGVPALAAIPDDDRVAHRQLIDFRSGAGPAAEAFRKLRANLAFVNVDNPPRTIVISSPEEGEGKSTTSANLASAIAESGHRVVLVDGDLRRPRVASMYGVGDAVGFTNYLTRELELADVIQNSQTAGVDVIGSGRTPPNPAELLESNRAKEAFEILRSDYDYVLIDAPPILPLADSIVLGQSADALLLVVCADRTGHVQARTALDELSIANIDLLGVVLNRAARPLGGYGRYSYYRSASSEQNAAGSAGIRA
ncbi:polysaccharide biosynthesis tyrosine autokinase [Gordonia sp. NPDC127522]|uniref:polysaccharide biosynthesis tyrosine autokinase n=1 Tax=Gordonia sp. NPDC127522 TaxID=3345390 RepID=UPI00363B4F46